MPYADQELNYVNKKIVIRFDHIPSGNTVSFKGMITSLSDKFNSEWSKEKVYGRSDVIPAFKGTDRVISIAWVVAAASQEEAELNLSKVSLLVNFLYPSYAPGGGGANTISASPLLRMKFTNLVASIGKEDVGEGLVGFVDGGFSVDYEMDEGFFDLASGILYPKAIKLSCTYVVLHTHKLGWGTDGKVRRGQFPYGSSLKPGGYKEDKKGVTAKKTGTDQQKKAQEQQICTNNFTESTKPYGQSKK